VLKNFYLLMAIIGTVIPWLFFAQFINAEGLNIPLFIKSLFVNGAAGGFSADVLISAVTFWVFAYRDTRERNVRYWWLIIPATLTVGLSLSLPLYLFLREGRNTQE
jgi:hypothetical protein